MTALLLMLHVDGSEATSTKADLDAINEDWVLFLQDCKKKPFCISILKHMQSKHAYRDM